MGANGAKWAAGTENKHGPRFLEWCHQWDDGGGVGMNYGTCGSSG
jgi:hypothetical protein